MNWTDGQKRAIETLDRNLCVSAGAGSGKTGVLVERFLQVVRLTHAGSLAGAQAAGVPEILVITFTEKATREVKQRIVRGLGEAGLNELRREVENAYISTIHGFCSRLLKENPFEAGVDPMFSVMEEAESRRQVRAAFEAALDRAFEVGDDDVIELASAVQNERLFGTDARDPVAALDNAVNTALARLRGAGIREDDLMRRLDGGEEEVSRAGLDAVVSWAGPALDELLALRDQLSGFRHGSIGALENTRRSALDALNEIPAPLELRSWAAVAGAIAAVSETAKRAARSRRTRANAPEIDNQISEALERVKEQCKALEPLKEIDSDEEGRAQAFGYRFLKLMLHTWQFYSEHKRAAGVVDNEDLQAEAVHLLEASEEVRRRYRRKFKHILVDEYQDTDPLQARLLEVLNAPDASGARPNTLFRVGDVQQSIYAFRNAEPSIFQAMVQEYRAPGDGRHVELTSNFRSRSEVLEFVNRIFDWTWRHRPDRFMTLVPGAEFDTKSEPSIELMVTADRGGRATYLEYETRAITCRIQDMVKDRPLALTNQRDSDRGRPARYGDIAVLMRAHTDIERYERAFIEAGIPYFVVGGGRGYYARYEIRDLLNILTLLDSPLDDLALLSTLRSPFVGLDMDTIYGLALFARTGDEKKARPFYTSIPEFLRSPDSEPVDRQRLREFYEKIEHVASMEDRIPVGQLLERLITEFQYDARLLVRPNGRRRLANLRKLLLMANSASVHGVSDFIRRLREIERVSEREGDAPTEEEDSDVVRLITIHKAKGLEFPVVFLADMARKRPPGEAGVFVCDPARGAVGCKLREYRSAVHHVIARSRQSVEEEESFRLLYVAMTRAIEHLVLCGSTAAKARGGTWAELVFQQCGILGPPRDVEVREVLGGIRIRVNPF